MSFPIKNHNIVSIQCNLYIDWNKVGKSPKKLKEIKETAAMLERIIEAIVDPSITIIECDWQ